MTSSAQKGGAFLSSLQVGRGMAALLIVLYHESRLIFASPHYWSQDPTHGLFELGHAGVPYFFVLSGFILTYVHQRDFGHPDQLGHYAWRRFIRIYPIYWIVLAAVTLAYTLSPSLGVASQRDLGHIMSAATLVYLRSHDTVLPVAWTLFHEVMFYAVFALAIAHRRLGSIVLALWFAASGVVAVTGAHGLAAEYVASPLHLLFALGIAVWWLSTRANIRHPGLIAIAGIVSFIGLGLEHDYARVIAFDDRSLLYGIAAALIVLGGVVYERHHTLRFPRVLTLLGDASYSLYLVHLPVLSVVARVFVRAGAVQRVPAFVSFAVILAVTVCAGILLHIVVERRLLQWLSRDRRP